MATVFLPVRSALPTLASVPAAIITAATNERPLFGRTAGPREESLSRWFSTSVSLSVNMLGWKPNFSPVSVPSPADTSGYGAGRPAAMLSELMRRRRSMFRVPGLCLPSLSYLRSRFHSYTSLPTRAAAYLRGGGRVRRGVGGAYG